MASASQPADPAPAILADYCPISQRRVRHDGWTAERQRTFLTVLAESGSVREACDAAGVCPRSAYRLRQRADARAFSIAWEQALRLATVRLTSIAFDRAVNGTVREVWRQGEQVAQIRVPSDRLLMFLLERMLPAVGGRSSTQTALDRAVNMARAHFPIALDALTDRDDLAMIDPQMTLTETSMPLPAKRDGVAHACGQV